MGYNAQLVQDEASPFEVILRSEKEPQPKLEVSGLKSGGSTLDKATIKCIMEHADKGPKKMDKNNEVLLFKEVGRKGARLHFKTIRVFITFLSYTISHHFLSIFWLFCFSDCSC